MLVCLGSWRYLPMVTMSYNLTEHLFTPASTVIIIYSKIAKDVTKFLNRNSKRNDLLLLSTGFQMMIYVYL